MELKTFTQFSALLSLLALSVAALPVEVPSVAITSDLHQLAHREAGTKPAANRPSKLEEESVTDQYLFNITLESFVHERECQCSPYLFWESDGCSDSPDHPFGFDYLPACYRHDFGYDNYKRQGRFTQGNKEKLDLNFKQDLDNICSAPGLEANICKQCREDPQRKDVDCKHQANICKYPAKDVCGCLAELYYRAVVIFGGMGTIQPGRKDKRGDILKGAIGPNIPKFDLAELGICLAKHLPSAKDKPTA